MRTMAADDSQLIIPTDFWSSKSGRKLIALLQEAIQYHFGGIDLGDVIICRTGQGTGNPVGLLPMGYSGPGFPKVVERVELRPIIEAGYTNKQKPMLIVRMIED